MDDYEYRGLMAQTWDYLRGDPTGRADAGFYRQIIAQYGEPVLDVGCGTGRLLLDFLAEGIEIDGVDISPEMLAICAEKGRARGLSPTLYCQSIEELALPRHYRTILAPSSVLQLLPDPAEVRSAMRRLYAHLIPGGVLISPFMTIWREGMPLQREWENSYVRPEDGALLHRMGRLRYEPETECEHTEDVYQIIVDGVVVAVEHHRRSPAHRSYRQEQARTLFVEAGLEDVRLFSGLSFQTVRREDDLFTVIGIRPLGQTDSD